MRPAYSSCTDSWIHRSRVMLRSGTDLSAGTDCSWYTRYTYHLPWLISVRSHSIAMRQSATLGQTQMRGTLDSLVPMDDFGWRGWNVGFLPRYFSDTWYSHTIQFYHVLIILLCWWIALLVYQSRVLPDHDLAKCTLGTKLIQRHRDCCWFGICICVQMEYVIPFWIWLVIHSFVFFLHFSDDCYCFFCRFAIVARSAKQGSIDSLDIESHIKSPIAFPLPFETIFCTFMIEPISDSRCSDGTQFAAYDCKNAIFRDWIAC